jgi:urease alpha subunit
MWRISRSNSIISWQDYRISASRLAESNFRYTQEEALMSGVTSMLGGGTGPAHGTFATCPFRKSYPGVAMMQSG